MRHLSEVLNEKEELCKLLEFKATCFEQQLATKNNDYHALQNKYTEQRKQRINDKAMVDQWCAEAMEMKDLTKKQVEDHQAAIEARDQERVKLIADHKAEIEAVINKAAKEQDEIKAAHVQELRALTKASKTNRFAWEKEKKALEAKFSQMDGDAQDTRRANEDEILRLTECKRRLEAENALLMNNLNQTSSETTIELAQQFFLELEDTRSELDKTRNDLQISNIKIENILEAMQQQQDHYEAHGDEESEARAQVCDLQRQVVSLEEKLAICNDLLRNGGNEPAATDADGNSKVVLRNQELYDEAKAVRKENTELLAKCNKVDDENLALSLKIDTVDEELHALRRKHTIIQDNQRKLRRERSFLSNAVRSHSGLTAEDKAALDEHLCHMTEENEELRVANENLSAENKELVQAMQTIEEKCKIEVDSHCKAASYWYDRYFDEAVCKVERLTEEISLLNRELGRTTEEAPPLQERLSRNVVVSNRNALRHACDVTLRGVNTALIPAEYYEPGFRPGWLPATHDALRVLRPLGWAPVAELGKVWLSPIYKPFTEEDAEARLEAEAQVERRAHRIAMGFPEFPGELPHRSHETCTNGGAEDEETADGNQPIRTRNRAPTVVYEEPIAPAYNPAWQMKRSDLTREAYEDMDATLKLDVLKMIGVEVE